MTPEQIGYLQDRLWDAGVLDVFLTPVLMKKNRPGTNVTVLLPAVAREAVSETLFSEGTTLGVGFTKSSARCSSAGAWKCRPVSAASE